MVGKINTLAILRVISLTGSEAVQKFGFGKHEANLPPSIAHSHKADLVSHLQ